jgi:predicted small lipoprotein YifL
VIRAALLVALALGGCGQQLVELPFPPDAATADQAARDAPAADLGATDGAPDASGGD